MHPHTSANIFYGHLVWWLSCAKHISIIPHIYTYNLHENKIKVQRAHMRKTLRFFHEIKSYNRSTLLTIATEQLAQRQQLDEWTFRIAFGSKLSSLPTREFSRSRVTPNCYISICRWWHKSLFAKVEMVAFIESSADKFAFLLRNFHAPIECVYYVSLDANCLPNGIKISLSFPSPRNV